MLEIESWILCFKIGHLKHICLFNLFCTVHKYPNKLFRLLIILFAEKKSAEYIFLVEANSHFVQIYLQHSFIKKKINSSLAIEFCHHSIFSLMKWINLS